MKNQNFATGGQGGERPPVKPAKAPAPAPADTTKKSA